MTQDYNDYKLGSCIRTGDDVLAPKLQVMASERIPSRIDLRGHCTPVEDQGKIGSCTANAVVGALEYHQVVAGHEIVDLSRLFVYYNARRLGDSEQQDTGATINHVMAATLAYGACPEHMWPYQNAMWKTRPTDDCYAAARQYGAVHFARTALGPDCKAAVASGLPVVFGISLPGQMLMVEGAQTGRIQKPIGGWLEGGGGHAMLIVGYDDTRNAWLVRNSWGTSYGEQGHVWIDYEVMAHYAWPSEYWTIGEIERRPNFKLTGVSQEEAVAATKASAPADISSYMALVKRGISKDLEENLLSTKKNIRDRLRGPDAGGGY